MIRKVKFSNFYSFHKEQEISFLAKKKKTYDYFKSDSGDQITKVAGFVGDNASGKTNIMRFFSFISYFVCRKIDNESPFTPGLAYHSFFDNDERSNFYIEFEFDGSIFFYDFTIQKKVLLNESLYIKKNKKGSKKIEIFSRHLGNIKFLNKKYFKKLTIKTLPNIREDVSLLTAIHGSIYHVDIIDTVYHYFVGFQTNINEKGKTSYCVHKIKAVVDYLVKDLELKKQVDDIISRFNTGLKGFHIEESQNKDLVVPIFGIHTTTEKNNRLNFEYESRGTQSLFFLVVNLLNALKHGSVVIVDEIETGLHPAALNKLISFFIDENKDKTAQLFFSSHSFGFMNKLDMHQIFLVEKNNTNESFVYRLNEVEGVRPDENFHAKYMTGSYGAFPKIRL